MANAKKDNNIQLGFLAVSATAPNGMKTFPVAPGFDDSSPKADLRRWIAKPGWSGYALSIDPKGKLRVRRENAKD